MTDWRHRAACRDTDPELHFPVGSGGVTADQQAKEALTLCRRCPVVADCLAWAVETGQEYGIWGGTTEAQRRELRPPKPVPNRPAQLDAMLPDTVTSLEAGRMCGYRNGKSFTERVRARSPALPRIEPVGRDGRSFFWDRVAVERFAAELNNERERWAEERRTGHARAGAVLTNTRHARGAA